MKHFVQYHNVEDQGGRPKARKGAFSVFFRKRARIPVGSRIWLISGEGKPRKTFRLEYTFLVEVVSEGETKSVEGSVGALFHPAIDLSDAPWFLSFKKAQFNFRGGISEIDAETVLELQALAGQREADDSEAAALDRVSRLTISEFRRALDSLQDDLAPAHREMLVGHANAPDNAISMAGLAAAAGYAKPSTANLQYGLLAGRVAAAMSVSGLSQNTMILATGGAPADEAGHWRWVMRPALVEALRQVWPDDVFGATPAARAASDAVSEDPRCSDLKATARAALVQARIGQGTFRKGMLEIWGGRCAITGCDIPAVLIASHAKPWSESSNQERLDPFNGLLLSASMDRLFDSGAISFSETGELLVSSSVSDDQLGALGLSRSFRLPKLNPKHLPYLAAHRALFGL